MSIFLLLTMGGAIFLSPVTVPLLFVTAEGRTRPARVLMAIVAGATSAEAAWAVTYGVAGESAPWVWVVPSAVFVLVALAVTHFGRTPTLTEAPTA
jgi:hypothetical protein